MCCPTVEVGRAAVFILYTKRFLSESYSALRPRGREDHLRDPHAVLPQPVWPRGRCDRSRLQTHQSAERSWARAASASCVALTRCECGASKMNSQN